MNPSADAGTSEMAVLHFLIYADVKKSKIWITPERISII